MILNAKRSESDIIFEILYHANFGVKKTHLLHKANMSHNQLNRYLGLLKLHNMISEKRTNQNGKKYYITDKGKHVFEILHQLKTLFDERNLNLYNYPEQ